MKIYTENKIRLTINLIIFVIVIPILINLLLSFLDKELYNEFRFFIHSLFISVGVLISTQYFAKIEINETEIARKSSLGSIIFKWKDITRLKHNKFNNRIILSDSNGKKLYFNRYIINYKSFYSDIYQNIMLHNKESIVDISFINFINFEIQQKYN